MIDDGKIVHLNLPCAHPGCNRMVNIAQPRARMRFDGRKVIDYGVRPLCDECSNPGPSMSVDDGDEL